LIFGSSLENQSNQIQIEFSQLTLFWCVRDLGLDKGKKKFT